MFPPGHLEGTPSSLEGASIFSLSPSPPLNASGGKPITGEFLPIFGAYVAIHNFHARTLFPLKTFETIFPEGSPISLSNSELLPAAFSR